MPKISRENISGESAGVECDDDINRWDKIGKVGASHDKKSSDGEGEDEATIFGEGEPIKMEDLGDEENHEPDDGDVVAGEKTIGDESGHHGELKEIIFWKDVDAVDWAKQDAAEFDDGDGGATLFENADNDNKSINNCPDSEPFTEVWDFGEVGEKSRWWI